MKMLCLCCCLLFAGLGRFSMKDTSDVMSQVAYNICRHLMQYLFTGRSQGRRADKDR